MKATPAPVAGWAPQINTIKGIMAIKDYTCPFCKKPTTLTDELQSYNTHTLAIQNAGGPHVLRTMYRVCPNPSCRRFSLSGILATALPIKGEWTPKEAVKTWSLIPASSALIFPDYVPETIRADYEEACAIKDLSPKASATLARRCLQGMIRHFWGVVKDRLIDEIDAIRDKVDPLTWGAIDSVRKIGNIGAHMEKDINVIVDVDPIEAEKLIWLIEVLVQDWYVTTHERERRLAEIVGMATDKTAAKKAIPASDADAAATQPE